MSTYRLRAERLRQAAAECGDHTSYAIAKRTGLSQTAVGRLRKGVATPSVSSLMAFARAYGVPVEELVERQAEASDPVKDSA
ncbi:helix-turn-helix domain-containing protein [Streptomyces sp. NPDC020983]|uniref:helix-turn-helix domain-containing protein n=1 Tax=Streptomyces sp. NPDC020983 TaxID=3365106 RepID=UPI0037B38896